MAILDVIKYEGEKDVLVWKHPGENFSTKSQLIVQESQEALLFKNGQALDLFGPGRHTLNTQNIPFLRKLINLPFGDEEPFTCNVYFFNKAHTLDLKWGTSNPIPVQDPVYKVILPISANGQFGVQVEESRKLVIKLVGTARSFSPQDVVRCLRGVLSTNIKDGIAKRMASDKMTFLEIQSHLKELSEGVGQDLREAFNEYGLNLVNFFINAIVVPEDDPSYKKLKATLSQRAEMDVMGYTYQQRRTFDMLENAAKNEGRTADVMGAGMGLSMGVNVGSSISQAMGQSLGTIVGGGAKPQSPARTCVKCGAPISEGTKFCSNCGAEQSEPGGVKCPHCGQIVPQGKFCSNCGAPLQRVCPDCGTPVTGNFCPNCGKKLGG